MKWIAIILLAAGTGLTAQERTRIGEIQADRDRKEQNLHAEEPSKMEQRLNWVKDNRLLELFSNGYRGLRMKVGGLAPGGGFAIGPEFSQGAWGGRLNLRAGAQGSLRGYQKQDLHIGVPRFLHDRLSLDVYGVRHSYPSLNYYGPGPESERGGRSNYRHEDTAIDATLTVALFPKLRAGGSAGYVFNNIGRGTDTRFISAEKIYISPGLGRQSNFFRTGAFIQYDYRDFAAGPRPGGNYIAQFHKFTDRTFGEYGFHRLDLEAQQYLPFFNKRRVIALRARSVTTFTGSGKTVPFYMQPMLGGSDDLRGYRPFRFRGDNLLLMNAEYRWEFSAGSTWPSSATAAKCTWRNRSCVASLKCRQEWRHSRSEIRSTAS